MPESREQAPRHILDNPEVRREQEHDEYEAGNEGGGEEPAEQVEHQGHQLEEQVEEDDQAVGGPAPLLHHQPEAKFLVPDWGIESTMA